MKDEFPEKKNCDPHFGVTEKPLLPRGCYGKNDWSCQDQSKADFPLRKETKDIRSSTLLDRRNTDLPWTREEHNTPKTQETKLDRRSVLAVL